MMNTIYYLIIGLALMTQFGCIEKTQNQKGIETMNSEKPKFEPNIILQSINIPTEGQMAGYKIDKDGNYYVKSNESSDWIKDRELTNDQLTGLTKILNELDITKWNRSFGEKPRDIELSETWVQIRISEKPYSVHVIGSKNQPEFITEFNRKLIDLFK